jgi:diguanylate cyclase (GGDEF)-like protein
MVFSDIRIAHQNWRSHRHGIPSYASQLQHKPGARFSNSKGESLAGRAFGILSHRQTFPKARSLSTRKSLDAVSEAEPLLMLRNRVLYPFAIIGIVFLLPFSLNDFYHQRYLLGAAIFCVAGLLIANVIAIRNKRKIPFPFSWLLIPGAASIVISISTQGIYGLLWSYPALLFFYFALTKRLANICTSLLLVAASFMCFQKLGLGATVRFVSSMLAMMVAMNIILNVLKSLQYKLQEQTIRDPLTGAYNRRHMEICLASAIERKYRHNSTASLLMLDVDYFKRINDELGHEAGDEVLRQLVTLMQARIRKLDLLFRSGGEEFIILLPETNAEQANILAEQLRTEIAAAPFISSHAITASIGVAELETGESRDHWLKNVDNALYSAKHLGRNKVVVHEA